jgi:hypothetical protein
VAVVVAALTLVSCDNPVDSGRPAPATSSVSPGLHLAEPLLQDRLDATRHLLTIPIVNGGPAEAYVRRVQIVAPHFAPVPPTTVDAAMEPGRRINFSIRYGTARCNDTAGPVTLVLDVGRPGAERQQRLAAPTPVEILDRLRKAECDEQRLASSFAVSWDGPWSQVSSGAGAARLRGGLRVTLTGSHEVSVTDLKGSVLFALDTAPAGRRPIVDLDAASRSATIPVEISVRMCHKHGLIEAKRIFDFILYAAVGDQPPAYRTITPPARVQKQALALLGTCPPDE